MGLKLVIEPVRQISSDIWEGTLAAEDLGVFNKPEFHEGDISVLLVKNPKKAGEDRLEFKLEYARVLNFGDSGKTLIIGVNGEGSHEQVQKPGKDRENELIAREVFEAEKRW